MLKCKLWTKNYKHDSFFKFKGEQYHVHSIVKLTEEGRRYLGSLKREVILIEQFTYYNGKLCWKYEFNSVNLTVGVTNMSTDRTPDELIEKIIQPANSDYYLREELGVLAPNYTNGTKHTKKDWEIPAVKQAWIIYIATFIMLAIFKDWYVKLILRIVASVVFGIYRQAHIDANTVYINEEDINMLKKKYEVLYGPKTKETNKK